MESESVSAALIDARRNWFSSARNELVSMPANLTKRIPDREERLRLRSALAAQVSRRLLALESMAEVRIENIRLVGHVEVRALGAPPTPEEKDSELIAMIRVRDELRSEGWSVSDVSAEGRGFDLLATRGNQQRCVEVKGVWGSASSQGVRLTANEVLIALQQGEQYWLYVVDRCQDGLGTIFGTFANPVNTFGADIAQDTVFRVPGSVLLAAVEQLENE
jgi:hypothetical protein